MVDSGVSQMSRQRRNWADFGVLMSIFDRHLIASPNFSAASLSARFRMYWETDLRGSFSPAAWAT